MYPYLRKTATAGLLVLAVLLSSCKKDGKDLGDFIQDLFIADQVLINMALGQAPELLAYTRLFTAPSHDSVRTFNSGVGPAACGGVFQAGSAKVNIAAQNGGGTLGTLVGDIPLAGSNRRAISVGNVFDEKSRPGQSPHHHFFKKTDGVLDSIDVRAVVINCNGTKYIIAVVDTVIMPQDVYDTVFASVTAIVGGERGRMMLSATHTHSGPGSFATRPLWKLISGDVFVPTAYTAITNAIISAITTANAGLVNARMGVGSTTNSASHKNRRSEYYSAGSAPLDNNLIAAQIQTAGGTPIATIFNYAVHGTALEPVNTLLSGDVLGDAMTKYENATPATGDVAIFLNGPEGDVSPASVLPYPANKDEVGTAIKDSVVTAVNSIAAYHTTVEIGAGFTVIDLPSAVVTGSFANDSAILNISLGTQVETRAYFNSFYFRLNTNTVGLTITSVPGEPITEVGTQIKSTASSKMTTACGACTNYTMVSALTNGYMGYITSTTQYDNGGYEAAGTMYGRATVDTVYSATSTAVTAATD